MARRIRRGNLYPTSVQFQKTPQNRGCPSKLYQCASIVRGFKNLKNKFQTAEAEEIKEMKEKLENIVKPIIGKMYENEEAGGGDAEDEDDEHDEL